MNSKVKKLLRFLLITMLLLSVVGGISLTDAMAAVNSITVFRVLPAPATVAPGTTFDVTLTFSAPVDNFNAIVLHDEAPAGWQIATDKQWCTPSALTGKLSGINVVEYTWLGPYTSGQMFKAVYKVTAPSQLTDGIRTFPKGWLVYYVLTNEYQSQVTGDLQVQVSVATDITRSTDTPANASSNKQPATSSIVNTTPAVIDTNKVPPKNITVLSQDNRVKLTLAEDTIGLTAGNLPVNEISVSKLSQPPASPKGGITVGTAYSLSPNGATFKPALNLSLSYDPANIPSGFTEDNLVIAFWNAEAGEWVNLDSVVHPDTKTVTTSVTHFTIFSILAYQEKPPIAIMSVKNIMISSAVVETGEEIIISALVANNSGNKAIYEVTLKIDGVVQKSQLVDIAAQSIELVNFATSLDSAGSHVLSIGGVDTILTVNTKPVSALPLPTAPPAKPINWVLPLSTGGGVVIIIGLIILIMMRRRFR
jgi:hypothetical protein